MFNRLWDFINEINAQLSNCENLGIFWCVCCDWMDFRMNLWYESSR